ncbi:MAG: carotenoid oxygenase family protein [Spongiibacteraceae bacterium]|jgi:carotenoid cleavage dioxygenase|nr:carotenoid oxygenase family protein [Spongiibacteraceae bacterium]
MEIVFPDIPLYRGWGAPLRVESDIRGLELIEGAIPADLNGTWYRAGPDRQYPPMTGEDIFIDGEGMVHRIHFDNGHVDYRSRWVRTRRFELQEQARRSLFGRYRNRYTSDPSVRDVSMGTANTNAIYHGGKLLVLKEDDLPYQCDPVTLDTIGPWDFEGAVTAQALSAHPKIDWHRNELLTYSHQARGDGTTDMAFYIMNADGKVDHEVWFHAPYPGVVHDFAVTDTHVIFPFFPLITDLNHLKEGGTFYRWYPNEKAHFAVMPRRGTADQIQWFSGPACSAGHMMNAFNEGSQLHLDIVLYDGNCFPFFPSIDNSPCEPCPPLLTRLSFDLAAGRDDYERRVICQVPGEMPRTDDRFQGKPYNYGFMICGRKEDGTSGIGRVDPQTGALSIWHPGPASACQEPQFVPRSLDAPEGDGYLLTIVNRLDQNRSDIAILDARDFERGPVALLKLPVRVRSTFHGTWVPQSVLANGRFEW